MHFFNSFLSALAAFAVAFAAPTDLSTNTSPALASSNVVIGKLGDYGAEVSKSFVRSGLTTTDSAQIVNPVPSYFGRSLGEIKGGVNAVNRAAGKTLRWSIGTDSFWNPVMTAGETSAFDRSTNLRLWVCKYCVPLHITE
ncbi:hypothetical protein B0H14DRAFT_2563891 [Mycena olivaceomarginata]|nr:hypothetical protein B0H14DRAFT_2563891 [Mycena olivaceomarginata]